MKQNALPWLQKNKYLQKSKSDDLVFIFFVFLSNTHGMELRPNR